MIRDMADEACVVEPVCQREPRKRLRVHFDAAVNFNGLDSARRLLIALPPGLRVVADLARALHDRLPEVPLQGLRLSIDGFTLPLAQQLHGVVRDDDVVTVRAAEGSAAPAAAVAAIGVAAALPAAEVAAADEEEEEEEEEESREPLPLRKRRKTSDPVKDSGCKRGGHSSGDTRSATSFMSSAEASHTARNILASEGLAVSAPSAIDELAARKAAALAHVEAALAGAKATAATAVAAKSGGSQAGKEKQEAQKVEEAGDQALPPASEYKVFVGGLPWSCDEAILQRDFSDCGTIENLRLLTDRETGRSRGMAFITFADAAGFEAALKFNGDDYGGRTLTVAKAEGKGGGSIKGKGKGKSKSGGKGPSVKPPGCTSIVVKGLAYEATEDELRGIFCRCGQGPVNIRILTDRETGESRGIAFVDFDDGDAVDEAVKLSETELRGRTFFVDYAKPRQ